MDPRLVIYLLCIMGGFILLIGGLILIAKKKVLIDPETQAVVDIEIPYFGKMKTNIPGLAFFMFGCALIVYPTVKVESLSPEFSITGSADAGDDQLIIYVALRPELIEKQKKKFLFRVPYSQNVTKYEILYISRFGVVSHQSVSSIRPGTEVKVEEKVTLFSPYKVEGSR